MSLLEIHPITAELLLNIPYFLLVFFFVVFFTLVLLTVLFASEASSEAVKYISSSVALALGSMLIELG